MSRTNTILKNMQPLLNYLVLIAPAIPTVSNSWIPLNPRLLVFVIVVSPTSSTFLPNHGALIAICDYSAADDLVGFHVAHPVVLPSCHPPLPRTIYWASCRVNNCWWKWRRREGATELWKSSEVHLNLFLMIQTQEWTESVADAPFIHFFGSNDVTWSFCWSTLLIFQSNTLWQSKWK